MAIDDAEKNKGYHKFTKRRVLFLSASSILLLFALLVAISLGSTYLDFAQVWKALLAPFGFSGGETADLIIWNSRLPRALAAIAAGAGLALGGVVTQTSARNPLASPFTLGIASAAAFGAAVAIIFGVGTTSLYLGGLEISDSYLIVVNAFFFSMVVTLIIFAMMKFRGARPEAIVLGGIAMNFLFSAATALVEYFGTSEQVAAAVFWTFGSLSKATWSSFWILTIIFIATFVLLYRWCWKLNALYMGDEVAKSLGVDAEKMRLKSVIIAALVTATVVSFIGVIGFVCLISPHIARFVVGGDHRYLIPASCLTGANILLISDTVSRTILLPAVLPVGILTSFLGVPLFLYLLIRRKEYW